MHTLQEAICFGKLAKSFLEIGLIEAKPLNRVKVIHMQKYVQEEANSGSRRV